MATALSLPLHIVILATLVSVAIYMYFMHRELLRLHTRVELLSTAVEDVRNHTVALPLPLPLASVASMPTSARAGRPSVTFNPIVQYSGGVTVDDCDDDDCDDDDDNEGDDVNDEDDDEDDDVDDEDEEGDEDEDEDDDEDDDVDDEDEEGDEDEDGEDEEDDDEGEDEEVDGEDAEHIRALVSAVSDLMMATVPTVPVPVPAPAPAPAPAVEVIELPASASASAAVVEAPAQTAPASPTAPAASASPITPTSPTRAEVEAMTVDDLKRHLRAQGRDCRGGRDTLMQKVLTTLSL
jgi:hypothetical protein